MDAEFLSPLWVCTRDLSPRRHESTVELQVYPEDIPLLAKPGTHVPAGSLCTDFTPQSTTLCILLLSMDQNPAPGRSHMAAVACLRGKCWPHSAQLPPVPRCSLALMLGVLHLSRVPNGGGWRDWLQQALVKALCFFCRTDLIAAVGWIWLRTRLGGNSLIFKINYPAANVQ